MAIVAERFIEILKNLIYKEMTAKNNKFSLAIFNTSVDELIILIIFLLVKNLLMLIILL